MLLFFFFQAEDGIRDSSVTGVQTCALPIFMTLGALLAVLCGAAMIVGAPGYLTLGWMRAKLLLVAALVGYHGCCYHLMRVLRAGGNNHSQRWYRLFNELPGLLLVAIVVLAVVKP